LSSLNRIVAVVLLMIRFMTAQLAVGCMFMQSYILRHKQQQSTHIEKAQYIIDTRADDIIV
jgi:hypothetical protein